MAIHQKPIDYIDIPAPQHSADAYYRVVYGDVDWEQNNQFERAIYVLMGYGDTLTYRRVAHILTTPNTPNDISDLDKVLTAIQRLKDRNETYRD
ncbi:hypothetical protein MHZ95_18105 [Sporosarcina sp. ACRSM]|uniref:hypothetical protein n=1 Tax=Sporosarcina sp. ACRSM TaxID=2918216 RepID=UPI001EF58F70|nr:hypothetical protein [Sporosarcina sp. ACRSM]MCG7337175.1 hypothetical protein [Sporosarcina sp. ACRSM]